MCMHACMHVGRAPDLQFTVGYIIYIYNPRTCRHSCRPHLPAGRSRQQCDVCPNRHRANHAHNTAITILYARMSIPPPSPLPPPPATAAPWQRASCTAPMPRRPQPPCRRPSWQPHLPSWHPSSPSRLASTCGGGKPEEQMSRCCGWGASSGCPLRPLPSATGWVLPSCIHQCVCPWVRRNGGLMPAACFQLVVFACCVRGLAEPLADTTLCWAQVCCDRAGTAVGWGGGHHLGLASKGRSRLARADRSLRPMCRFTIPLNNARSAERWGPGRHWGIAGRWPAAHSRPANGRIRPWTRGDPAGHINSLTTAHTRASPSLRPTASSREPVSGWRPPNALPSIRVLPT